MADDQYSDERWLPVVGFEGVYEVSDYGRVRSLSRVVNRQKGPSKFMGQMRKLSTYSNGYLFVALQANGVIRSELVHRLVAKAFIPNESSGDIQVNHKDGVRTNNHVSNLEWVSCSDNQRHAHRLPWRKRHSKAVSLCAALDIGPAVFESAKAASRYFEFRGTNVNNGSILSAADRSHRCLGFYFWRVQ